MTADAIASALGKKLAHAGWRRAYRMTIASRPCRSQSAVASSWFTASRAVPSKLSSLPLRARRLCEDKRRALIIAEYNYTDEHGELLYQVVRTDPKELLPAGIPTAAAVGLAGIPAPGSLSSSRGSR